ncbi:MAG TPA: DUF378 domain-containing protein [Patescibacteria group bacterium]|nr:DUF378 domain-containing protein [Patescibacteria group bacterium]
MKLKTLSKWLVVLGALEVGFMSVLNFDLVGSLIGKWPTLVMIVYAAVGLSGLWGAFAMLTMKKKKK